MSLEPTVYRIYDADDVLLYVGLSRTPMGRVNAHMAKPWGSSIARYTVEAFADEEAARTAERLAIRHESPVHNDPVKAGGSGRRSTFPLYDRLLGGDLAGLLLGWRDQGLSLMDMAYRLRGMECRVSTTTVRRWLDQIAAA